MALTGGGSSGGGGSTSVNAIEKPTGQVAVSVSNNSVMYTVPPKKYFKGTIIHSNYNQPFQINPGSGYVQCYQYVNVDTSSESYRGDVIQEWVLYAGTVVKSGSSGSAKMFGVEYSL